MVEGYKTASKQDIGIKVYLDDNLVLDTKVTPYGNLLLSIQDGRLISVKNDRSLNDEIIKTR